MNDLISVCVPSYKRPAHLLEAVTSCFSNNYRPLEILIGDDSRDDLSERAIADIKAPDGITLRYCRNSERLGQPANVNALFDRAQGDRLILLHDDDRLLPGAIDVLDDVWIRNDNLAAVFGKQRIIDMKGAPLSSETDRVAKQRFWAKEREGVQESPISSALVGQFPMDGYLIRADIARKVRYNESTFRGDGSDYDFGVRFALKCHLMTSYYIDSFTMEYRSSDVAISRVSMAVSYAVQMLTELKVPAQDQPALDYALKTFAAGAVPQLARRGLRREALRLFFSRYYPLPKLSVRGAYCLASIALPKLYDFRTWLREAQRTHRDPMPN